MDSPPKRMTRARAAAKASEPTVKTTKIVTAAARAKSAATASTKSTAAKRKTRADEHDEEEITVAKKTRGRPKKADEPEVEAPVRATRGRAAKKPVTEARKAATKTETAPARATRGRPKKVAIEPEIVVEKEEPAPEPVKKTVRARAATATKSTTSAKPATKKTVKFQEPDKENIEPTIKAKEPASTGLRGRPTRRGAAARTTRAAVKASTKKPLSPKKVTQMPVSKDESEDELAGDSPVKPMMKSPLKLPSSFNPKKIQFDPREDAVDSIVVFNASTNPPDLDASVFASPARRPPPASPFRESMRSPAKRIGAVPLPGSALKPHRSMDQDNTSPFKTSLLQSAAKRPQSPIKGLNFGSSFKTQQSQSAMKVSFFQSPAKRAFPGIKPLTEPRQRDAAIFNGSPAMKPFVASTPTPANAVRPSEKLMEDEPLADLDEDPFSEPIESLQFPGRLSAVLPRDADPAFQLDMGAVEEVNEEEPQIEEEAPETLEEEQEEPQLVEQAIEEAIEKEVEEVIQQDIEQVIEPVVEAEMTVEEVVAEMETTIEEPEVVASTPPQSPEQSPNPMYQLRDKDLDPCHDLDSDSEDELTKYDMVPATPTRYGQKTPRGNTTGRSQFKAPRVSMSSFTALAEQLGSWRAHSPVKKTSAAVAHLELIEDELVQEQPVSPLVEASPVVNNFFEDEMSIRPEHVAEEAISAEQAFLEEDVEEPSFDDIMVTDEDVALAQEAKEMSLLEPELLDELANSNGFDDAMDDTLSEDSQEYGDENDLPFDPAAQSSPARAPVTPVRLVMKTFNTTTKVPLKPADESSPTPLKKRSFSASRVAPKRPSGLGRNATVISYSPMKENHGLTVTIEEPASSAPATPAPVTPSKSDLWSSIGTPARTPRRDLNPALLRGAVVFVDVYTSEGADASGIFVELLTQMGAKCLKNWTWNPSSSNNGESSSNKIGITHVVYKDGGKRTLEKVRGANGVVQCVGVSWVLE